MLIIKASNATFIFLESLSVSHMRCCFANFFQKVLVYIYGRINLAHILCVSIKASFLK